MKVALDLSVLQFDAAGSGLYARELARHLPRLAGPSSVIPLSFEGFLPARLPPAARVLFHDLVWIPWLLGREALRSGAELLHCPAYKIPFGSSLPFVVTFHDLSLLEQPGAFNLWPRFYARLNFLRCAPRARLILTDSEFSKRRIVERLGMPSERVRVIALGLREELCRPAGEAERARVRQKLLLPERYVLFVGTLEPRKNIPSLMRSFQALCRRRAVPHELVLAGRPGREFRQLRRLSRELGLESKVRFLGKVSDEDLAGLYASADLFVYLSVYEGFGLPPLEAMSQGVVTVVSNCSSLPEVAGDGAILVDPENEEEVQAAMERGLTDRSLRETLAARAVKRAGEFSWEATARKTLEAYRLALEGL